MINHQWLELEQISMVPKMFELLKFDSPGGRVVNAADFGSGGPEFEPRWRRNSAYDCMAL